MNRAVLLYHIANSINVLFLGFLVFRMYNQAFVGKMIDTDRYVLIGVLIIYFLIKAAARRVDPQVQNPMFLEKNSRNLTFIGLACFVVGALMMQNDLKWILLAGLGVLLELLALVMSMVNAAPPPDEGDLLDDNFSDDQ